MIINRIKFTEEEQRERERLNQEYMSAIAVVRETMPDDDNMTFVQVMNADGVTDAVMRLTAVNGLLKQQLEIAERRHMNELGTSDAILAEANEIIEALEKKDFQDFIKPLRKAKQIARQNEQIKEDKDFQDLTKKRYNYDFRSAYAFVMSQVHPYHVALQELGEEKEIIENDKPVKIKYSDLLGVMSIWKVRDSFGYTPPSERKKKKTVSLKDELTAVEDINVSELYNKSISDNFTRSVELSIGKKPKKDVASDNMYIETPDGQFTFIHADNDMFLQELDRKAIPSETVLVMHMLLGKVLPKLPTPPALPKGKKSTALKKELAKIEEILNKESNRTAELSLNEYMDRRKLKGRKSEAKKVLEYALMSLGTMEKEFNSNSTRYNMFSARPQEMYKAGNIKAVFNRDWLLHLYEDGFKMSEIPEALYTVDLRRHQYVVSLYGWLRQNYESNADHQAPNTNRVKVMTTIEKIPTLHDNLIEEQENGKARYWQRVIDPLFTNLDALKNVYGLLDYEILDKNKKKITGSKFNKMSMKEKLECWIRYELSGRPNWNAPEQLTTKKKPKDTEK